MNRCSDEIYLLDAATAVKSGKTIYLFSESLNLLYEYDCLNNKTRIISSIPSKAIFSAKLVKKILLWEDQLILLPGLEKCVWLYSLTNNKWESIELKDSNGGRFICNQGFIYDNCMLCVIGLEYPYIIHINLKNRAIDYDDSLYLKLKPSKDGYFKKAFIWEKDSIVMGCRGENVITVYNYRNKTSRLINISYMNCGIEGVERIDANHIALASYASNEIYICNNNYERVDEIILPEDFNYKFLDALTIDESTYFMDTFDISNMGNNRGSFIYRNGKSEGLSKSFYFCDKEANSYITMDNERTLFYGNMKNGFLNEGICLGIKKTELLDIMQKSKDTFITETKGIGIAEFLYIVEKTKV